MRVYISCPFSVDRRYLDAVVNELRAEGIIVDYWKGIGCPYDNRWIENCDAFILMTENNAFKVTQRELPSGCGAELSTANRKNKKMYLAYKSTFGVNFYDVKLDISSNWINIEGIAGSTGNIWRAAKENKEQIEEKEEPKWYTQKYEAAKTVTTSDCKVTATNFEESLPLLIK